MIKSLILGLIKLYQLVLSPILGPRCRFTPTCSNYCSECFSKFPIPKAMWYSIRRLSKCHPFHSGGYDPVPGELNNK
ncbi:MAG: membrane protein insertion efficiency factor YidD [Oligoflexia bacterium]|nr:membrane protein insertion efficiency factor YidD [Oligoflexia bacterium]